MESTTNSDTNSTTNSATISATNFATNSGINSNKNWLQQNIKVPGAYSPTVVVIFIFWHHLLFFNFSNLTFFVLFNLIQNSLFKLLKSHYFSSNPKISQNDPKNDLKWPLREGAKNILRGGCLNLALLRSKIPTPPENGNIGLDPP